MKYTTVIKGFSVELDADKDETHCFVMKGEFSSSLQCLLDCGVLTDYADKEISVPSKIVDEIEEWAVSMGW